ncbi:MAG: ABC transporter permease [Acidobacteriaceae bacterium]|nr:ABC transporter permease [Acidobacteriaceae bacterium]
MTAALLRDFAFGFRLLLKNRGFAAIAILALALGIGPNTAIFSIIYATLLAPMPYPHPEQLVMVWSKIQGHRNGIAAGDYLDWKNQSRSFQGLWAESGVTANLTGAGEPVQLRATALTPGMLTGWGAGMLMGRDFLPQEGQPGNDHEAVLMHKLWVSRFGARPDIIGRRIQINAQSYTVVGVLPPGQQDRMPNELYLPLAFQPDQINHDFHWLLVMGRLKPGVTIKQAQSEMDSVTKHIGSLYPQDKGWGASVEPLRNDFVPKEQIEGLWLLMGGVGFVLLIACANVANLLLARGTARQREIAVRASIGASRPRLISQLLAESLALASMGGILGIALGWAILKLLMACLPDQTLPSEADVALNLPVLLFSLAATVLAGVLAGCAPSLQAARLNLNDVLKQSSRSVSAGRYWARRILVVAEFTLALALLAGAGLAVHSFWIIMQLDLGIRIDHILTFSLPVPDNQFTQAGQIRSFYSSILEKIKAVPGVSTAATTLGMPLEYTGFGMPFYIAGKPFANPVDRPGAGFQPVSPEYFDVFGIRLVRGRHFDDHDTAGSPRVVMVDENFVRKFLKGVDPLRQRVVIEQLIPGVQKLGPAVEWQIIGVFHTVQYGDHPSDAFPVMYVPFAQVPWPSSNIAVGTSADPAAMTKSIAAAVHSIAPNLPLADIQTMDQIVTATRASDRFATVLLSCFAADALLLAALGIYGVFSFLVEQRTHEIGLRMALGAGQGQVMRLVLWEGSALALAGLLFGATGAWLVGRAMASLLYGVSAIDPQVFVCVSAVLLAAALLACYVPAHSAARVDPMLALRQE